MFGITASSSSPNELKPTLTSESNVPKDNAASLLPWKKELCVRVKVPSLGPYDLITMLTTESNEP